MRSDSPAYLALVVVLMLGTIAYLSGCTQLDTHDIDERFVKVTILSTDEACEMHMVVSKDVSEMDKSLEIEKRK